MSLRKLLVVRSSLLRLPSTYVYQYIRALQRASYSLIQGQSYFQRAYSSSWAIRVRKQLLVEDEKLAIIQMNSRGRYVRQAQQSILQFQQLAYEIQASEVLYVLVLYTPIYYSRYIFFNKTILVVLKTRQVSQSYIRYKSSYSQS